MSDMPRDIYRTALGRMEGKYAIPMIAMTEEQETELLRKLLVNISEGVRQTKDARIARKALKDASYARMFGGSEKS